MLSPIWVKTQYEDGEYINISKAISLRIDKVKATNGDFFYVNSELVIGDKTVERTLWAFNVEADAADYLKKLVWKTSNIY
jgi:hypothetical protein